MKIQIIRKVVTAVVAVALLINSLSAPLILFAQVTDPGPTPEATTLPLDTPTPEQAATASEEPTPIPDVSPAETATPTAEATPVASSTTTPFPESVQPETQNITDENAQPSILPSESPTTTPLADPAPPEKGGDVETTVVENIDLSTINLLNSNVDNSRITTDKPDYSPTSMVLVTGTGFTANKTYTIEISSTDQPPITSTDDVTSDPQGAFIYSYQLDGNYRPNYKIEIKNEGVVIASTTFTDADFIRNFSASISPTSVNATASQAYTLTVTNSSASDKDIKSFTVFIPSGFSTPPSFTSSVDDNDGKAWSISYNSTNRLLKAKGSTGSSKLDKKTNDYLSLTVTTTSPSISDTYEWTVRAWETDDWTNSSKEFSITSAQPSVFVNTLDTTSPATPTLVDPTDGAYIKPAGLVLDWSDSTDPSSPVTYVYQVALSSDVGADNALTSPIYTSGSLSNSEIDSSGMGDGTYYWQARACDSLGNCSDWSGPWAIRVDGTAPTIAVHGDETAEAVGPSGTAVSYVSPATNDNIDASGTATCSPASGAIFGLGDTTVTCNASDTAGNVAAPTSFVVHVVDTTAPVLSLPSDIIDEALGPNGNVESFTATASDLVDGPTEVSCTPLSGSTFGLGDTTVNCNSTDSHGNTSEGTFKITVQDTTAPSVSTTSPSANSYLKGIVTITADATDAVGITKVEFWHATVGTKIGEDVLSPYSIDWDTTSVSDGTHDIWAVAYDNAGHQSSSTHINITIDNTKPVSTFNSPETNSFWKGGIVISGSSTDIPNTSVDYLKLYYRTHGEVEGEWIQIPESQQNNVEDTDPFEWSFSWTPPTEGYFDIKAEATDRVGNVEASPVVENVVYDITKPSGSWTTPAAGDTVSGTVSLNFAATDNLSGVQSVAYWYWRNDSIDVPHEIAGTDWDTTELPLDSYTLKAVVTDNAGNASEHEETVDVAAVVSSESSNVFSTFGSTVTWNTDRPTSSRVVYDTVPHSSLNLSDPNYGYAYSTGTSDTDPKVLSHSVTITGLADGTLYYYRVVSAGSPAAVSPEREFKTYGATGAPSSGGGGGTVLGVSTEAGSWPKLTYAGTGGSIEKVLGTETQETGSQEEVPPPTTQTEKVGLNSLLEWILGHKKISLITAFIFIAIGLYVKKRKKQK